jgi:hypothetical protein
MAIPGNDSELLLLVLLLQGIYEDDDPFLNEVLYDRIRRKLKQRELLDPELDHLLERRLHYPGRYRSRRLEESREIATSVLEGFRQSFEESTNKRIGELETTIAQVAEKSQQIELELGSQREALDGHRRDAQDYFWLMASGADIRAVAVTRYVPVRAYISDPVPQQATLNRIVSSLERLLDDAGFEKTDDFPEESGSWWKRLVLRTKDPATQKEVTDKLKKVERAAEIAYLDKPQAEANQCQAQAAASLIGALKETENACIQAGSLLVVKATNNGNASIVVRTLTPIELKHLEENQAVLRRPEEILDWLQGAEKKRLTKP